MSNLFNALNLLEINGYAAVYGAAKYIKPQGITIRKPNDCLIAFYAIHFNWELLQNDSDFDLVVKEYALSLF